MSEIARSELIEKIRKKRRDLEALKSEIFLLEKELSKTDMAYPDLK